MSGSAKVKVGGVDPSLLGLVGPFTKIARAMSAQWNVQIIPSGFACMTDGEVIYIPFTSDFLPPEQRQFLHGMLDHEVCHVVEEKEHRAADRATPMDIMRSEPNKTIRFLINVVEDFRIEHKWSKVYPGVAENLEGLHKYTSGVWERKPEAKKSFWDRLGCAFFFRAKGIECPWAGADVAEALDKVRAELDELPNLRWCQDSYDIAERIYRKLKADAEETLERDKEAKKDKKKDKKKEGEKSKPSKSEKGEPAPPAPEGDDDEGKEEGGGGEADLDAGATGSDDSEDESADGGEESADDDDDAEESDDEGKASGEEDEDSDEEEADEEKAAKGEEGEDEEPPTKEEVERAKDIAASEATDEDLIESVKKLVEDGARADAKKHHRYVPDHEMKKRDRFFKPEKLEGADENYKKARADVNAQIGAIRSKQLAYIQTITRKRLVPNQDSGRLDTQRLASVRTGSVDVFNFIKKGRNLDTCFEVLLDLSGSMGSGDFKGCAAYYAKRTAIGLAEPWESLRIPYEMIGFSNNHSRMRGVEHTEGCVRRAPFDFFIFKGWNERLAVCRERFVHIRGHHDNADGEAVHAAACRLAIRPEKRRILVVISDGLPCHSGVDTHALNEHLKATVTQITRAGIEVIGVGAGTDAPTHFYNKSTGASNMIIKDLSKLATTLFTTLRDRMLG